jgi:hypothetical protein
MNGPRLRVGDFGEEVARLQESLQERGLTFSPEEQKRKFFGPTTREAVGKFQAATGIDPTYDVCEATANKLQLPGAIPDGILESPGTLSGGSTGPGVLAGGLVVPEDMNGRVVPMGAETASEGVQVNSSVNSPIRVAVSFDQARVSGSLVTDQGFSAAAVPVRVYRRELFGDRELVAEFTTDQGGNYDMVYSRHEANNIEIYAVAGDGVEHQLSTTLFGAGREERIDLVAPAVVQPAAPEFGRLVAAVAPHTDGDPSKLAGAVEIGDRRDLTPLAMATGWDAAALAVAADAFSNAEQTQIPAEGLYALGRVGLPTDVNVLARVERDSVAAAFKTAVAGGIIDSAGANESLNAVNNFVAEFRLNTATAGTLSAPKDFLQPIVVSDDLQSKKISVDDLNKFREVVKEGFGPDIWERAKAKDVTDDGIAKLQLQGKLAYLTFNNAPLTLRLMAQVSAEPRRAHHPRVLRPADVAGPAGGSSKCRAYRHCSSCIRQPGNRRRCYGLHDRARHSHSRRVEVDGGTVALLKSAVRVGIAPPLDDVREALPVATGIAVVPEQAVELVAPP